MFKQGGSVKTWKRRFFVLRGLVLAYYKTDQDTAPQGTEQDARAVAHIETRRADTMLAHVAGWCVCRPCDRHHRLDAVHERREAGCADGQGRQLGL